MGRLPFSSSVNNCFSFLVNLRGAESMWQLTKFTKEKSDEKNVSLLFSISELTQTFLIVYLLGRWSIMLMA